MNEFCEHRNGIVVRGAIMALIGVGANIPGPNALAPLETCQRSVAALDLLPGVRLCALSRWFLTAPVPPSGQPDYVNAAAALRIEPDAPVDPALLLARLMQLEAVHGRQRSVPNPPR